MCTVLQYCLAHTLGACECGNCQTIPNGGVAGNTRLSSLVFFNPSFLKMLVFWFAMVFNEDCIIIISFFPDISLETSDFSAEVKSLSRSSLISPSRGVTDVAVLNIVSCKRS